MPATRKSRKTKAKPKARKVARKKSSKISKNFRVHQSLAYQRAGSPVCSPFPPNLWTQFTYSISYNATQALGGIPETIQFRLNGMQDPVVGLGGIKPRYFNSLLGPDGGTAPYRVYRVHASKIEVDIFPKDSTAVDGNALISVIPQRSGTGTPGSIEEMRERPYGKYKYVSTVGSWKPQKLVHFAEVKTHLGHKDLMDVDATGAAWNGLPNEQVYWNISQCSVDSAGTCTVSYTVTITYYVQLYTLADVADS